MGSEMCIRDSLDAFLADDDGRAVIGPPRALVVATEEIVDALIACLLYTSDAADERSSVDLGGRRIIKKKSRCMTS